MRLVETTFTDGVLFLLLLFVRYSFSSSARAFAVKTNSILMHILGITSVTGGIVVCFI
jgi:hypothetical protein